MKKKIKKNYELILTEEEISILKKAQEIIEEISEFGYEHNIDELMDCCCIEEYLDVLVYSKEYKNDKSNPSAWDVDPHWTEEQTRCFLGDFA